MLVPVGCSAARQRRRRVMWLIGAWAVTVWTLWSVWPVQPRLTLESREHLQIVGITPDSRSLVSLTRRAWQEKVKSQETGDEAVDSCQEVWSGPIQVWDLQTGAMRRIGLPRQKNDIAKFWTSGNDETSMIDPDHWGVTCLPQPFDGRKLRLLQWIPDGESLFVEVDLDQGTTSETQLPKRDHHEGTQFHFSPSGRWSVEEQPVENDQDQHHETLAVYDTRTGVEILRFDAVDGIGQDCFSADETQFSFSANGYNKEEIATTQIWQLEPAKLLQVIPRRLGGMAFSPDKKWIASAGYFHGVEVIEVATGNVVHQFSTPNEEVRLRKPAFSPDATHLIAYEYLRGGASGMAPKHEMISEIHVWHLPTGGHHAQYLSTKHIDYFDPSLCEDGWLGQATPLIVGNKERLFDVLTGKTKLLIPTGTTAESLSSTAQMVVLQRLQDSRVNRMLSYLDSWNIPYWDFLRQDKDDSELLVVNMLAGRAQATVPFSHTWGDHSIVTPHNFVMSSDERSVVTVSSDPSLVRVWDIPPRHPILSPLVWSLFVPIIFGVFWWLNSSRLRRQ